MMRSAGVLDPPSQPSMRPVVAPYVTTWSAEQAPRSVLVARPDGIGYADESVYDRDEHGVLWERKPLRRGVGRPLFAEVHPLRQRRAMRRLLCQVCGGPADQSDYGVLWLLQDHREDWPGWPNRMGVTEPPVCVPCVGLSVRLCPALRRRAVVVRVGSCPVAGVGGVLYEPGFPPVAVGPASVELDDEPAIRWVIAAHLIRRLGESRIVPMETVVS